MDKGKDTLSYKDKVITFFKSPANWLLVLLLVTLLALLITMIVYVSIPIATSNVPADKYHIVNYDGVCESLKLSGVQQYDLHVDVMPNETTPNYLTKANITDQLKKTFDAWTTDNWQNAVKQLAKDVNSLLTTQTDTYVKVRAVLHYDIVKEDNIEFEHVITNKSNDSITWVVLSNQK